MKRIYLDHNATTPCDPEIAKTMADIANATFANPSSTHHFGNEARRLVDDARKKIAACLGAHPDEIIFTSGGTEADNMALIGTAMARKDKGDHIVTSKLEHPAVLKTCEHLACNGFQITYLKSDEQGHIHPEDLEQAITSKTILVSLMTANNETGTISPIQELAGVARKHNVAFHSDTVQVIGKIPIDFHKMGVDFAACSAHKLYGPKGVGFLYAKEGARLKNISFGGGQELGKRPGTLNVAGIVALSLAVEQATKNIDDHTQKMQKLTETFFQTLVKRGLPFHLNGDAEQRLPNTLNCSFPMINAQTLVAGLDLEGYAVSAGSACESGTHRGSPVLEAMGLPKDKVQSAIRISMGRLTGVEDMVELAEMIGKIANR